jgi:hypothetical protein
MRREGARFATFCTGGIGEAKEAQAVSLEFMTPISNAIAGAHRSHADSLNWVAVGLHRGSLCHDRARRAIGPVADQDHENGRVLL